MPGYPAWAGIDRLLRLIFAESRGLPRVGGDRPDENETARRREWVTPRGRG